MLKIQILDLVVIENSPKTLYFGDLHRFGDLLNHFLTKWLIFGRIDLFSQRSKSLQIFFIAKLYTCSLGEKSLKFIRMSQGAVLKIFRFFYIFLGRGMYAPTPAASTPCTERSGGIQNALLFF